MLAAMHGVEADALAWATSSNIASGRAASTARRFLSHRAPASRSYNRHSFGAGKSNGIFDAHGNSSAPMRAGKMLVYVDNLAGFGSRTTFPLGRYIAKVQVRDIHGITGKGFVGDPLCIPAASIFCAVSCPGKCAYVRSRFAHSHNLLQRPQVPLHHVLPLRFSHLLACIWLWHPRN
jgi:hypothetical protein